MSTKETIKGLCEKYGLRADFEIFNDLVFIHHGGSNNSLGECKVFTMSEVQSHPDLESELVEMCVNKIWN
jgi:hypothetical protein